MAIKCDSVRTGSIAVSAALLVANSNVRTGSQPRKPGEAYSHSDMTTCPPRKQRLSSQQLSQHAALKASTTALAPEQV